MLMARMSNRRRFLADMLRSRNEDKEWWIGKSKEAARNVMAADVEIVRMEEECKKIDEALLFDVPDAVPSSVPSRKWSELRSQVVFRVANGSDAPASGAAKPRNCLKRPAARPRKNAMSQKALQKHIVSTCQITWPKACALLDQLEQIASTSLAQSGKFKLPGICRFKVNLKPATDGKIEIKDRKIVETAAKPERKTLKCFINPKLQASALST